LAFLSPWIAILRAKNAGLRLKKTASNAYTGPIHEKTHTVLPHWVTAGSFAFEYANPYGIRWIASFELDPNNIADGWHEL